MGAARGLKEGSISLLSALALESMNLTARLAQSAQGLLETADDAIAGRGFSQSSSGGSAAMPESGSEGGLAALPRLRGESELQYARRLGQQLLHYTEAREHEEALQAARAAGRGTGASRGGSGAIPFWDDRRDMNDEELAQRVWMSKMANQPANLREGLEMAYASLYQGLLQAADRIVLVPREEYQRGGAGQMIKSVVTGLPSAVLRPLIGGTAALSKVSAWSIFFFLNHLEHFFVLFAHRMFSFSFSLSSGR